MTRTLFCFEVHAGRCRQVIFDVFRMDVAAL